MISFVPTAPLSSRMLPHRSTTTINRLQYLGVFTKTTAAAMRPEMKQAETHANADGANLAPHADRTDCVHRAQHASSSQPTDTLSPPPSSRKISEHLAAKRREKPPMRHTEHFETPHTVTMRTIGVVRSPYKERFGTPRQPNVTQNTLGNQMQPATIELYKNCRYQLALRGLAQFEYCWLLSFFHLNQGFNPLVTPPRGPKQKQGVFATRSPHRPNSVGLSCVRITAVDERKGLVHLLGVDLLDGTPVLDIKP
eukprot:gb/GEZJ01001498.1/.p2 GENE.gb/GEZJ01001498.1/~~gb/GEZJ01001498.1/.p2  ORF type:complete len:253 (+),score=27.58 gb/GEZJ01001498.1/:1831-2589(+)